MYAQVVVDLVHENLSKTFTYIIPPTINLSCGMRVKVPFGAQTLMGIVMDISDKCDVEKSKLKQIISVPETYPAILPALISLAKTMASEIHCPLAETLRLMIPAEMRRGKINIKQETVVKLIQKYSQSQLEDIINQQGKSTKRKLLLNMLSDTKIHLVSELAELISSPLPALNQLQSMGFVKIFKREVFRLPYGQFEGEIVKAPALMQQQQRALQTMNEELNQGKGTFLIHGVTGSGKTEVYLSMIEQVLEMGKDVIVLVPEISLTPQMVRWFRERFADSAAVLHSRLSAGEKYDEWRRIRLGQARVVIGARSAVFAPLENLGLIVIDEEHESSYQSDRHPRYDARHIAMLRAKNEGATLVLSSATPSIKSFNMALNGEYTLIEMPNRVMNRPLPAVNVVDMRKEIATGNRSIFSDLLKHKLQECLDTNSQAILFLNRRGYSTFVSCRSCGYVIKCDNCDISLTYHITNRYENESLKCHMCGQSKSLPKLCPSCNSEYIRYFGGGTQKVEQEVIRLFPKARVVRMDIDTVSKKNSHDEILEEFRSGRANVLIGTQMITKGLDFPRVTLVGVIAADSTLNLPDYRAPERTFQLITQVAGRAGRANQEGSVVVQTYKPDHPCIIDASNQDYRAFFSRELYRRKTGYYPPYTQIARLLVEGKVGTEALSVCETMFKNIKDYLIKNPKLKSSVIMLHMDEAPIKKIMNKIRYHIILKLFVNDEAKIIKDYLEDLSRNSYSDVLVYMEVDPVNMM